MGDFDFGRVMLIVLGSATGLAYFRYGKSQASVPFLVAGVALMAYGYFVAATWALLAVGAALAALPFVWRRYF